MTRADAIQLRSGPGTPYTALLRQAVSTAAAPAEHRADHRHDQELPAFPAGASLQENENP